LRSIDAVLVTQSGQARKFGFVLKTQLQDAIELYKAFHDQEKKLPEYAGRVRAPEEEEVSRYIRNQNGSDESGRF
jgi:hypothetical protein